MCGRQTRSTHAHTTFRQGARYRAMRHPVTPTSVWILYSRRDFGLDIGFGSASERSYMLKGRYEQILGDASDLLLTSLRGTTLS